MYFYDINYKRVYKNKTCTTVRRVGFEPTKHANAADLQSDAIVHSAIPSRQKQNTTTAIKQ